MATSSSGGALFRNPAIFNDQNPVPAGTVQHLKRHHLPEMSDDEDAMLAEAFNVRDNSRLGCQIHMTDDLDGLEVELAPES